MTIKNSAGRSKIQRLAPSLEQLMGAITKFKYRIMYSIFFAAASDRGMTSVPNTCFLFQQEGCVHHNFWIGLTSTYVYTLGIYEEFGGVGQHSEEKLCWLHLYVCIFDTRTMRIQKKMDRAVPYLNQRPCSLIS